MLPHARPGGIAGFMELLVDRGGRDDLYKLADELAMDVDDILPIVDASVMLGFAVLNEGDVEITPEGRQFGEADIQTQKHLFRDAALKHIALLRLIENTLHAKRDHAIGEEFFRDILDERFDKQHAEQQFQTALDWGAQMAQGLAAAHQRGITHRDVKPENAFVGGDGPGKLLAFGIAKLAGARRGHDLGGANLAHRQYPRTGSALSRSSCTAPPAFSRYAA